MEPQRISANGLALPKLGQGGWYIGDIPSRAAEEIAALRLGLKLGLTLIDTAEMYGNGNSELLIGRALLGIPRGDYRLVSKVLPQNAGGRRIFESCEASLKRLNTEYLDLYLLHWRGAVPLAETIECMEALVRQGKILRWGVSNFDTADMEELWNLPGGVNCAANQVLYHIASRGIEFDLIPWLRAHGVAAMAYCPLAQAGRLVRGGRGAFAEKLAPIAEKYRVSVMQLLLAFVLRQEQMIAIPKAGTEAHVRENRAALEIELSDEDWRAIDRAFPPPTSKTRLDIE